MVTTLINLECFCYYGYGKIHTVLELNFNFAKITYVVPYILAQNIFSFNFGLCFTLRRQDDLKVLILPENSFHLISFHWNIKVAILFS